MEENNNVSNAAKIISFIGIGIIILSIFLPAFELNTGFRYKVFTPMDFSETISMLVFISCIVAVFGIFTRKFEFVTIVSNSLMLHCLIISGIVFYRGVMQSVRMAVDITFGGFIFFFGIVIMEIGGILCGLSAESGEKRNFFSQWFYYSKKQIELQMINFSGILVSLVFGILIAVLTATVEL